MANGKIRFGKQSGGQLSLIIPNGATNTEVTLPESGELATKQYVDSTTVKLTENQTIEGIKTFSSNIDGSITGNAGTATKLQTARTINGVNFDGSANITVSDGTKIPTSSVVQTTGTGTTTIMSQKATTDELNLKANLSVLGTAATKNVGNAVGDVMEVGAFGLGGIGLWLANFSDVSIPNGFYTWSPGVANKPVELEDYGTAVVTGSAAGGSNNHRGRITIGLNSNRMWFQRSVNMYPWTTPVEIYHTGNSIVDANGFIKMASPILSLYTDKIEIHNKDEFGATPTMQRISKGVYQVNNTLGLRLNDGWYIETPNDRNGNKYFNIEWTQNITPDTVDGVVDEYRDDIVVTIETFERVWNKDTGMFDNGNPIDINDLQNRFVQLRFNEIKVEQEMNNGNNKEEV